MGAGDTSTEESGTQPGAGDTSAEESGTGREDKWGQRRGHVQKGGGRARSRRRQHSSAKLGVPSAGPGGEGAMCIYISLHDLWPRWISIVSNGVETIRHRDAVARQLS
jgi:hypothetical protein